MTRLRSALAWFLTLAVMIGGRQAMAETIPLKLRSITRDKSARLKPIRVTQEETWDLGKTAVIVCDVWDLHHCLNAVRRLEEFAPRLDQVLKTARAKGAIIIHSPSDCMPAYADHPARQRATDTPLSKSLPEDIQSWCSRLKSEYDYPIDQSDGGEDDDPTEHAAWAAKLKALGRNPGTPWKKQSDLITIDSDHDYISDRGDEVWSILEKHGIQNVILTGVHCNMCVLGRPFGLRQMVRNGKHVVLMRDMTDSMYSPKRWPHVDHVKGHDLVIQHVERFVCPTITSDQLLGGQPFRWKSAGSEPMKIDQSVAIPNPGSEWAVVDLDHKSIGDAFKEQPQMWYRGALRVPAKWLAMGPVGLSLTHPGKPQVWLNGHELSPRKVESSSPGTVQFLFPAEHLNVGDYSLIVVRLPAPEARIDKASVHLLTGPRNWIIDPVWQVRTGDSPEFTNIPLPAKFGIGPDAVLRLRDLPDAF